jgi:hypothetical protein
MTSDRYNHSDTKQANCQIKYRLVHINLEEGSAVAGADTHHGIVASVIPTASQHLNLHHDLMPGALKTSTSNGVGLVDRVASTTPRTASVFCVSKLAASATSSPPSATQR